MSRAHSYVTSKSVKKLFGARESLREFYQSMRREKIKNMKLSNQPRKAKPHFVYRAIKDRERSEDGRSCFQIIAS